MNFLFKLKKQNKIIGIIFIISFFISTLFPIVAGVSNMNENAKIGYLGYLDVAIAFFCFLIFVLLSIINRKQKDIITTSKAQKITEYVSTIPLILISLYLIGVKLNWDILLIGIGWRFWLLIIALPYLVSAFTKKLDGSPDNAASGR